MREEIGNMGHIGVVDEGDNLPSNSVFGGLEWCVEPRAQDADVSRGGHPGLDGEMRDKILRRLKKGGMK